MQVGAYICRDLFKAINESIQQEPFLVLFKPISIKELT